MSKEQEFTDARIASIETVAILEEIQQRMGYAIDIIIQQQAAVERAIQKLMGSGAKI